MSYENISISELGLKQKIKYTSSRVAFFVPRLLSKIVKKIIVNPTVKIMDNGVDHKTLKEISKEGALAYQRVQASFMQDKIDSMKAKVDTIESNEEILINDLAKYKLYKDTLESLEKKQTKLMCSPKKLLVARVYLLNMKKFRNEKLKKRKEQKELLKASTSLDYLYNHKENVSTSDIEKKLVSIFKEYENKQKQLELQRTVVETKKNEYLSAQEVLNEMTTAMDSFMLTHSDILKQLDSTPEPIKTETVLPVQEENLVANNTVEETKNIPTPIENVKIVKEETHDQYDVRKFDEPIHDENKYHEPQIANEVPVVKSNPLTPTEERALFNKLINSGKTASEAWDEVYGVLETEVPTPTINNTINIPELNANPNLSESATGVFDNYGLFKETDDSKIR